MSKGYVARIRYLAYGKNTLISKESFDTDKLGRIKVLIDLDKLSYAMIDPETHKSKASGRSNTRHSVKKAAKAHLRSLGVQFAPEKRMWGSSDLQKALEDIEKELME